MLVAPSFSQNLLNRCKWIDAPITLFTFICLVFEGSDGVVALFNEQPIPPRHEVPKIYTVEDHLEYITDVEARSAAAALLREVEQWKPGLVSLDPVKGGVSMKVKGRVFAYFYPLRKHYMIETYNREDTWARYPIHGEDDLGNPKALMRASLEARMK